jgi:hypothetical protein
VSKFDAIKELIKRATPKTAALLLAQLEKMANENSFGLGIAELIFLARNRAIEFDGEIERNPNISRHFFSPFEAIFESDVTSFGLLPGSFDRSQLALIWNVLSEEIDKEYFAQQEGKIKTAFICNDNYAINEICAKMRNHVYNKLIESNNPQILHDYDNKISRDIAQRFTSLLRVEIEASKRNIDILADVSIMSDAELREYSQFMTYLDQHDINMASDFLLVLMGNSKKPWQVLRLIKTAVIGMTDLKLSVTAYNIIGIRLLAILDRKIHNFTEMSKSNDLDGSELAKMVEDYNQMSVGLERCDLMIEGGPWLSKLRNVRANAAQSFNKTCENAYKAIDNAFPLVRVKLKGFGMMDVPKTSNEMVEDKLYIALELSKFIRDVRLYAPNAGFGGARDSVHKELLRHCDTLKNGLFALQKGEEAGRFFGNWSQAAIELVAIVDDSAAAKSLGRKLAA